MRHKWELVFAALLAATGAQAAAGVYPTMAPRAEYMMDRSAEIALARSAAPPSIARDASVMVLGPRGYEMAVKGTNGFLCLVERSWESPFGDPEFWNPRGRAPICFNAAAARSVVPAHLERTDWALAGQSQAGMVARTKTSAKAHMTPEPGSMCFMLSKEGHLSDEDGHWHPHLMFFMPRLPASAWGANRKDSPIYAFAGGPEPVTVFLVPVMKWSDGTLAEAGHHDPAK
ncbi:MAG TPA: hypothetical protein VG867_06010 [Rhizomicrobium sp.]|nr:hypothetical protein [Rhizomicrobium sp.]